MFKYNIEIKTPNSTEWEQLKSWTRPFTDGTTLDDTLDEGCINLSCTKRSEPIPPFSKLRITISESDKSGEYKQVGQIIRVVGDSKRTRKTFAPSMPTLWDWTIQTLEETKLLERYICDSMTSTNYLTHDYISGQGIIQPIYESAREASYRYGNKSVYRSPYLLNYSLPVYSAFDVFDADWEQLGGNIYVDDPNGKRIYEGHYVASSNVKLNQTGTYKITYKFDHIHGISSADYVIFYIGVVDKPANHTDPTITSVCERLLSAGVTRRQGIEKQKFELDKTFADKYKDVPAPEFSFTRQTLFEALLTVGGYIHAIPRLNTVEDENGEEHNVITFDELGGNDEIDTTNFPKQVYCDVVQSVNDFCSTLDSPAQNLLNTQDRVAGAITEFGNDYITVRAEDAEVIIDADTAIIRTSLPINQIVKLECGFINGRTEPVGDITAYVYESSEYDVLSSFWGTSYPYSKGYALRYVQGDNKITGLQTKVQYPNSVNTSFNNPAIINIILMQTGKLILSTEIHKLAFRVTYVPIVTSRVTQRKPYGNVGGTNANAGWDNTLVYNQGGNVVESTFYGDKMKGAIARLGNQVVQQTYDFYHYAQLPKCGQKLNGMYIARVDAEYDITRIRATLTLTKDFNMLSQYVGLNSNVRMYDISEKQSVERFINYSENIYIGDEVDETPNEYGEPLLNGISAMLRNTFAANVILSQLGLSTHINTALIEGVDKDGNDIGKNVVLPVATFGFGNSLVFAVSMHDNYGAGFQNTDQFEVEIDDKKEYKGVQRLVPYTDGLGEIEILKFNMTNGGWVANANAQESGGYAQLYPQYVDDSIDFSNATLTTGSHGLIVKKDSREALSLAYQAHFVANRETIVVGPALSSSNYLITNLTSDAAKLYLLKNKLNMLDKVIDLSEDVAKYVGIYSDIEILIKSAFKVEGTNTYKARIYDIKNNTSETYSAWAIVQASANATHGTLFIGENVELAPGQTAPDVYFTICSNAEVPKT